MTNEQLVELAQEYDVNYDDVSVAAIAAMLTRSKIGADKKELLSLFSNLSRIMDTEELVDVVKWSTWVKHANKEDLKGKTAQELMDLQKATVYA